MPSRTDSSFRVPSCSAVDRIVLASLDLMERVMGNVQVNDRLSPVVMFAYDRPEHTRITLEHLARNRLANQSHLFVFCDGPKPGASEDRIKRIEQVHEVVGSKPWTAQVTIRRAEQNKGLAKNVMEGVSELVEQFGTLICLEDDLKIGKGFLEYMNTALAKYADAEQVKQISGFQFPFEIADPHAAFFMPVTNTIGWGTWKRAWDEVDVTAHGWEKLKSDKTLRRAFNLDGAYDYFRILIGQLEQSKNDSWAILYWWSVFQRNGLVLYPGYSLIQHNDFGNAGVHKSDFDLYDIPGWHDDHDVTRFPDALTVNEEAFRKHRQYLRKHTRLTFKKIWHKTKMKTQTWFN